MIHLRLRVFHGLLCGLLVATAGCGSNNSMVVMTSDEAAPHEIAPQLDPQIEQYLKPMCTLLDEARAMRFRVRATVDRPVDTGQLAQFHRTSDITVMRPDRLYVMTESDDGSWSAWHRGETLTLLDRDTNAYATLTVPVNTGEMLDELAREHDVIMPMADLLAGKTYESLTANVESAEYLGRRDVDETPCHHLLCRQDNIQWQIWIQADGPPLPRKLVITYTQEAEQPQYAATIDRWDLKPGVSDDAFSFAAPSGAAAVSLLDLIEMKEGD